MSNKFSKFIKWFILFIVVIIPVAFAISVKADSGWDSDYDSGGGWSSSDSWSSNSWDSDYSGGNYHSSSNGGGFTLIIFIIIVVIVIMSLKNNKNGSNKVSYAPEIDLSNNYTDIDESIIKDILPDLTLGYFKNMAFNKFVEIQNAWSDFEYEKLRDLCTDELYNSYISQLETLKLKNGKNVMSDFELRNIKVIDIKEEAGNVTVKIYLKVSFYDYVINATSGEVTRGNKARKITNNYEMTFIRSKEAISKDINCPNCGADISANTSGVCPYCDSTIVKDSSDFVLSKKTNVNK